MSRYFVVYRAHDATEHLHSAGRPGGIRKRELIQVCFLSLLDALEGVPHRIHVVGDALSEPMLRFFGEFDVTLTNEKLGPNGAYARAVEIAAAAPDEEWAYLCEDDYLHRPECFRYIDELIENRARYLAYRPKEAWKRPFAPGLEQRALFIFPPDYPSFYSARHRRPSLIFQSRYCHWRQISNTTFSFITQVAELRRRRAALDECARDFDDGKLSRRLYARSIFWGRGLCLSPIPGLASHMHEGTMTALGDWDALLAHQRARLAQRAAS